MRERAKKTLLEKILSCVGWFLKLKSQSVSGKGEIAELTLDGDSLKVVYRTFWDESGRKYPSYEMAFEVSSIKELEKDKVFEVSTVLAEEIMITKE